MSEIIVLMAAFVFCLALSAFSSGAEMAFVSVSKIKLRQRADSGQKAAQRILRLKDDPQQFLTTVLIANNITNVIATSLVTFFLGRYLQVANEWLVTGIMAPLLIIFCEMVPKDYGRLRAQGFLLTFSIVLDFFYKIFSLPVKAILKGVSFLLGPRGTFSKNIFVDEEELRLLIEESAKTGVLGHEEKQLINTILDFERIQVDSVMIPLEKVAKVEITANIREVKQIARQTKSRMVLVYEELPSIVVGMIYVFDLLFEAEEEEGLKRFLRSPIFLPRHTSIGKALLTLQQKRQSFAVATDSQGDVIGVVPIERLVVV